MLNLPRLLATFWGKVFAKRDGPRDPLIDRINSSGFSGSSGAVRSKLLLERALEEGQGDPFPALLEALKGSDPKLSMSAAQLIGDLASRLTDEGLRREIIQALVNALNAPHFVWMTHTGFPIGEIAPVQIQAAETLGKLKDPSAVLELGEALHSGMPAIRRAAAWALGEIGAPEAVDALSEVVNDPDGDVCSTVRIALRRIGTPNALAVLEGIHR